MAVPVGNSTTPVKKTLIDCFICHRSALTISFALSGRKCVDILTKLPFIITDTCVLKKVSETGSLCRSCFTRLDKTIEFMSEVREGAERYARVSSTSSKRVALSPITPKSTQSSNNVSVMTNRSRKVKRLPFMSDDPVTSDIQHGKLKSSSLPNMPDDLFTDDKEHGYAASSIPPLVKDAGDILSTVKERFDKLSRSQSDFGKLRSQASSLTSRTTILSSVLHKHRNIADLHGNAFSLLNMIVEEMTNRVPQLFNAMICVAVPNSGVVDDRIIPCLAAAYAILMKHKYNNLTAFHRLTTAITIKGGINERGQTRLNQMGLTLSTQRRLKFQDSVSESSNNLIVEHLRKNPLIKITGDNLDIYVRTSQINLEKRNRDLHLFTSNIIFSRLARMDMDNQTPPTDATKITADDVLLAGEQKDQLLDAYGILIGRIMCRLPAFNFLKSHIPSHIPHPNAMKMAEKSTVLPLPIQFRNEAKHDDCLGIMDQYEDDLVKLYTAAFGDTHILRTVKVPIGGDQLTRIRLQESKNLRTLSVVPEKRFDDLNPIVCEMWHSKQDFLEKCYKTLYKPNNTPGTLHHFKTILHRFDVNGKVKGRFESHHNLLIAVGEGLMMEQIFEYFKMEDDKSVPQHVLLDNFAKKPPLERKNIIKTILRDFLLHYEYGSVLPTKAPATAKRYKVSGVTPDGKFVLQEVHEELEDELRNYSMNLCHWALHVMELDDTAKEGDITRVVLNSKYAVPFFYSHSPLSKYMVENIDYIVKVQHLLSPLQRCRVLEGSFVNVRGGMGNNVESDLVQEHSVCNQKSLIKTLGANKSEAAISRVTGAADLIADLCQQFDKSVGLTPKSGRHSKHVSSADLSTIAKTLRKLRPFKNTPGRKCDGFSNIKSSPLLRKNIPSLKDKVNTIIKRLTKGLSVHVDEFDEDLDLECEGDFLPMI